MVGQYESEVVSCNTSQPYSQNEFIGLLGSAIRNAIVKEINESPFYTVMADTTPDLSKKRNQMSIVIRFLSNNGIIHERLLRMMEAVNKTGVGIANDIYNTLNSFGMDTKNPAFQSYDYASNMAGKVEGVHEKLSELIGRSALYVPCQSHETHFHR